MKKLIGLALCMFAVIGFAASNVKSTNKQPIAYQVDVLIFKHTNLNNLNPDLWQAYKAPDLSSAIQLQQPELQEQLQLQLQQQDPGTDNSMSNTAADDTPAQLKFFTALSPQEFLLNDASTRLAKNNKYQLITQMSWIQPADNSRAVQINGGQTYGDESQDWELNGSIKLTKGSYQYLKLVSNLELAEPNPEKNNLQSIYLNETRRLLPKQLNYLDTPAFGMLVQVKAIMPQGN